VGFAIGNMGYLSWGAAGENESPLCRNMLQYNPGEDKWAVLEVFPSIPSIYARGFVINNTGFFTTGINLYNPLFTWSFTPGTVGIKVDNRTHSSIYPNPVNNELHLSFQDEYIGDVFVCLIDVYGKTISMQRFVKVEKSFQTSMDLSSLSPGFYSVIIKDKSGNFLSKEKVVKQ
jgi:hypothetical protein